MCGVPVSAGAGSENLPCASVLPDPTSCIPCDSDRSVTSSPAEGFPVVPSVTVPVMFCADALVTDAATSAIKTIRVVVLSEGGGLWAAEVEGPLRDEINWG